MADEISKEMLEVLKTIHEQNECSFREIEESLRAQDSTRQIPTFLRVFERVKSISYNRDEKETRLEIVIENTEAPKGTQKVVDPPE